MPLNIHHPIDILRPDELLQYFGKGKTGVMRNKNDINCTYSVLEGTHIDV